MAQTQRLIRPNSLVEDAWLRLGNLHGAEIENQLIGRDRDDVENPGLLELRIMRNPEYLGFAAKVLLDIDVLPEQAAILQELWVRPFPMYIASRGFGKSFLLALYATLRCALIPGTKVVGVGSAFRQSRVIYEYMDTIWRNAPILRSVCTQASGPRQAVDRCSVVINDSTAVFVPLGDGSKIRGLRATCIIADEFASIPPDIYETVVRGFAAVEQKPLDGVKGYARREALQAQGQWTESQEQVFRTKGGNQCIIAGTADYDFMPYADYWKKYMTYIRSKGDPKKLIKLPSGEVKTLGEFFPDGVEEAFDYKDYAVIRIPYELIPKGFMDDKVVAAAKAGSHKAIYQKEYGAVFPSDSDGFFKRSLIESCVTKDSNPVVLPSGSIWFDPVVAGTPGRQYVYGIDPAAEQDNFSIVILELWEDHTRIVYSWSTNVSDFQRRKKAGMASDHDYYGFCARKIRNLMKVFPTENIALDAQGGGRAILEAFHDPSKMEHGEHFLWPTSKILDPGKELPTDHESGLHIIHMCQFANFDFTSMANHGTRKDFEDKVLLFPRFDPVSLEMAAHQDRTTAENLGVDKLYDTLEDCVMEIEELKDELCTIVMTRTGTGVGARDRWDTPETTTTEGKKKRMRKDRYSSLVMANYVARSIQRAPASVEYSVIGGFSHQLAARKKSENPNDLYQGPEWFTKGMNNDKNGVIGHVIRKNGVE